MQNLKFFISVSPGHCTSSVLLSPRLPFKFSSLQTGSSKWQKSLGPRHPIERLPMRQFITSHPLYQLFLCQFADAQKPTIVEGPKNQSVLIGSNATLSCTARGLPRPTIYWVKDNATYPSQSDPRARVILDGRTNRSHLFIMRVEMEDYGKYQCIANNSIGRSQSGVAVLTIG